MNGLHAFVDSMGSAMDYPVATEDSNFMTTGWFNASGAVGIPAAFVVNQEERVAWIGLPDRLEDVLPKVLNRSLDIEKASAERISNMRWEALISSYLLPESYRFDFLTPYSSSFVFISNIPTARSSWHHCHPLHKHQNA
jgi:hypothetical protein